MPRLMRIVGACLFVLTSMAVTPLAQPETVQATSQLVTDCTTDSALSNALTAVQGSGGGTVIINCTDPIVFTGGEKTITGDVTIIGDGAILDGNDDTRLFFVDGNARLALIGLTLRNGSGSIHGGAIYSAGMLEITASSFDGNNAAGSGGAVHQVGGSLEIRASTFSNNSAGVSGGAVNNSASTANITSSTFDGNTTGVGGGAIYNSGGTVNVTSSTFHGSSAGGSGQTIYNPLGGTVTISASILANSVGANCFGFGAWNSTGYNLIDDQSCGLGGEGDQESETVTINLGDLQDNGGPTDTMLPESGSDAIGAIPVADCLSYTTSLDQRGVPRPQGDCEIGAVELGDVPVQIITTYQTGPIFEGATAIVGAVASGPAGATLTYEFDCDDNGDYEFSQIEDPMALCQFPDSGNRTVPVRVSDGTTSTDAEVTVQVLEATPEITSLDLVRSPSDEAIDEVKLTAAFSNPNPGASHNCTIDWGDGTIEDGHVVEADGSGICQGTNAYADNDEYTVSVEVCDSDDCDQFSDLHIVNNLPPVIEEIAISGGTPGNPVTIIVIASDPAGDNDPLSYEFDCNNDGNYDIGPQSGNTASCVPDSDTLSFVFGVRVSDDDGGQTEQIVNAALSQNYCVNPYTGALSPGNDGCRMGQAVVVVRADNPTTFCASPWTRELRYWQAGCQPGWQAYIVPGLEPIPTCVSIFTRTMRLAPATGACGQYEALHLIPATGGMAPPPNPTR